MGKAFASSPLVLMKLGDAYHKSMRYADAERCLQRSFSLDPCRGVAESLAWCFYEDGDEDRWLRQMERAAEMGKSATLTDRLTAEGVYAEIARRLLWQGKTSEAFSYAERAERSGSAWGFSLIARCYEVKGDFTNAEKYIRRRAKSYGRPFDWYFWCHRTGQGDLQSAKASISDDLLEAYHASSLGDEVVTSMLFHRLNGELEEAINRLTLGHSLSDVQGAWSFLHWELMKLEFRKAGNTDLLPNAYELKGNIEPEDDVLRVEFTPDEKRMRILSQGIAHHEYFTDSGRAVDPREFFVELRRHLIRKEKQPLNLKRLDWIVRAYGSPGSRTNMLYWIGKVLLLDDRKAEAIPYLKMAATSTYSHKHNAVLAGFELGELGMASGRLRSTEMEFEEAEQFRLYDEAISYGRNGELNRAIMRCEKIIKLSPDWAPAYYYLGQLQQSLGNDKVALEQYGEALRLKPEISDLRMARGNVFQKLGQFEKAVAEYEKVLELNPRDDDTHWRLGMLRAAAPIDELRDGNAAVVHASSIDRDCLHPNNDLDALFAAAHAERGDFETAVQFFEKSSWISLGTYEEYQEAMADYKAGIPFRLSTPDDEQSDRD